MVADGFGVAAVAFGLRTLERSISSLHLETGFIGPILVNDMNDTVGNKNVGCDNLGAINENTTVVDCDG